MIFLQPGVYLLTVVVAQPEGLSDFQPRKVIAFCTDKRHMSPG